MRRAIMVGAVLLASSCAGVFLEGGGSFLPVASYRADGEIAKSRSFGEAFQVEIVAGLIIAGEDWGWTYGGGGAMQTWDGAHSSAGRVTEMRLERRLPFKVYKRKCPIWVTLGYQGGSASGRIRVAPDKVLERGSGNAFGLLGGATLQCDIGPDEFVPRLFVGPRLVHTDMPDGDILAYGATVRGGISYFFGDRD